jgi:hypothetical protein
MSSEWMQEYTKLTNFVNEHQEIKITKGMIRIPSDVRPQFYAMFDSTRRAVVKECMNESLDESHNLACNYQDAVKKALKLLNLKSINSQSTVQRFLDNVDDWLVRELLDPLFNLLNGTINSQQFENNYVNVVKAAVPPIYEKAYGKWVAVSLINLLQADALMTIPLPRLHPRDRAAVGGKDVFDSLRPPEKSDKVDFQFELFQLFTTPDYIVHSSRLGKYLGIRTQYEDSLGAADILPLTREWLPVNEMGNITSGMMLIYISDNPMDIAAVADRLKICRPDMIIECRTQKNWMLKEGMDNIKRHHNSLKPACGTFVMSDVDIAGMKAQDPCEGIQIIPANVEDASLKPVIDSLISYAAAVGQTA